jgi:hypothetical protein
MCQTCFGAASHHVLCPAGAGDAFSLQLPRLGALSKARLWLEGPGSPWHLNLLVVTGPDGEMIIICCSASWSPSQSAQGQTQMSFTQLP